MIILILKILKSGLITNICCLMFEYDFDEIYDKVLRLICFLLNQFLLDRKVAADIETSRDSMYLGRRSHDNLPH